MVKVIPDCHYKNDDICRGCALGKNAKKTFPISDKRSKRTLDLIHSDTCGPMLAPFMSGCLYYVIFIDDFSHKTWIYFLKSKTETFNKFRAFKELVEK
jgi:hypothetical protein